MKVWQLSTPNKLIISKFWVYIPVIVVFGYVPLLAKGIAYEREILSEQIWFPDGYCFDFFLYFKSLAIILCAVAALIIFITDFNRPYFISMSFIPLGIYTTLAIASAIISPYKSLVFLGSYEMMEGLFVILSYVFLCVYTAMYISRDGYAAIRFMGIGVLPGVIVVLVVGFIQTIGIDIYSTSLGSLLLSGTTHGEGLVSLVSDPENPVFSFLYNADYAGVFFVMVFVVMAGLFFSEENYITKILFAFTTILAAFDAVATKTSTAILAIVFICIIGFLLWVLRDIKKRKWGIFTLGALVALSVFIVVGSSMFRSIVIEFLNFNDGYYCPLKEITTDNEAIEFDFDGGSIKIRYDEQTGLPVSEKTGNLDGLTKSVVVSWDNTTNPEKILIKADIEMEEPVGSTSWSFNYYPSTGKYYYLNPAGKDEELTHESMEKLNDINHIFPDPLFNHRGLIWNHTFSQLQSRLFIGAGANAFIMSFPQNDYIEELRLGQRFIDVKPHSFYLQQWVDHGLVALIGLLAFIAFVIVSGIKVFLVKSENENGFYICGGLLLAIFAQLFMGITQDSNVCSSPIFWICLGMIFGLYYHIKSTKN